MSTALSIFPPPAVKQAEAVERFCPVCDTDNHTQPASKWSRGAWRMKECTSCQLLYLENAPTYQALAENHSWTETFKAERAFRRKREPLLQAVSGSLKWLRLSLLKRNKALSLIRQHVSSGNLLDIGCGEGKLFEQLSGKVTPWGVEIDAQAAAIAHQRAAKRGGEVQVTNALEGLTCFPADYFDGILLHSFIEHEIRPRQLLTAAAGALKENGRLIMKAPNFNAWNRHLRGTRWCGFRFPDHVNYFTPDTFRMLVERAGLKVVQFGFANRIPTSDNMWMVAGRA